jgi:hypothetical protein
MAVLRAEMAGKVLEARGAEGDVAGQPEPLVSLGLT